MFFLAPLSFFSQPFLLSCFVVFLYLGLPGLDKFFFSLALNTCIFPHFHNTYFVAFFVSNEKLLQHISSREVSFTVQNPTAYY
jgi:hypothetical protein